MWHQLRPPRPGDRITSIAGVGGSQHRLRAGAGGRGLLRGEPVPHDGLGQPVHHQPALVDAGQRLPGQPAQGLLPGQRIRRPGGQLPGQVTGDAGEQVQRDRLRRQERAHASQLGSGRVIIGEPVGDQPGRRGQRLRVRPRDCLIQQLPGPGRQQVQVLDGAHAGLGHEPARLHHRQRQVPQLGRQPARIIRAEPGHPVVQEGHRFVPCQHVDLDRRGDFRPRPLPGGNQHMARPARQPPGDISGFFGVVEDQQPPPPLAQVGQHRRPHLLGACPRLDTAERGAQGGELVADQPALLGVDPPAQLIGPGKPVRILDRQLGLAHPAHPLQRLHHRLFPAQQPVPHRHQQPVPAGEPRITGRQIPHPRQAARQPRTRTPHLSQAPRRARPREHRLPVRPRRSFHRRK